MPPRRPPEKQSTWSQEIDFPALVTFEMPDGRVLQTLPGQHRTEAMAEMVSLASRGLLPNAIGAPIPGGGGLEGVIESSQPPLIVGSMPYCFCIKMTRGSYTDYTRSCLLHCGISDDKGRVFNFDEGGHHVDRSWRESICVPLSEIERGIRTQVSTGCTLVYFLHVCRVIECLLHCPRRHREAVARSKAS
jgi:hypothetical protein